MMPIRQTFFRGLITFIPLAVTIYIIYAGIVIVENLLGSTLRRILPAQAYVPGLGFLFTILLIFLLGLLFNNFITGSFFHSLEKRFMEVPFIKAIYSPLRDLMNLFSKKSQKELKHVVLVDIGESGIKAMGLITREAFKDLPSIDQNAEGKVAVYLPMSYGLGGFTFLVPKNRITEIDLPIEKAMSLAITGWVKAEKADGDRPHG